MLKELRTRRDFEEFHLEICGEDAWLRELQVCPPAYQEEDGVAAFGCPPTVRIVLSDCSGRAWELLFCRARVLNCCFSGSWDGWSVKFGRLDGRIEWHCGGFDIEAEQAFARELDASAVLPYRRYYEFRNPLAPTGDPDWDFYTDYERFRPEGGE